MALCHLTAFGEGPGADKEQYAYVLDRRLEIQTDFEQRGQGPWFVFVGLVNSYPKMESESLIQDILDPALRALAPGFDDVNTVSDLRDAHMLWVPQIGIGRVLSPKWVLTAQAGFAKGKIETKATDTSIFGTPMHSDFFIKRGATYVGAGLDYFPFGVVERKRYKSWAERLRAARPGAGASVTVTHATFEAELDLRLEPLPRLLVKLEDNWTIPSLNAHLALDVPLGQRHTLSMNGGYTWFKDQKDDFEGFSFSITVRHFFR
jgi:hypothetical protein